MQNFTTSVHFIINTMLALPGMHIDHWSDHATEKFKALEQRVGETADIEADLLYKEKNVTCEVCVCMGYIRLIKISDTQNLQNCIINDVTDKSDIEINQTARYLFEKVKAEQYA